MVVSMAAMPRRTRLAPALALVALIVALAPADTEVSTRRAGAQERSGPTLALGGDVIFDGRIVYAIERFYDHSAEPALRELLSELAPTLAGADLSVINLECPVAPRTHERSAEHDAPTFAAPPVFLDALAATGVDAITVANNHAYDQGVAGLASTLEHAQRAGLAAIGAGRDADAADQAVTLTARGHRVAFLAFSEGTNRRVQSRDPVTPRIAIATAERIAASVRTARRDAALVVVSLHWMTPLDDDRPTRSMISLARTAAEAGADLIYAHGPHFPAPRGTIATQDGRHVPVLWSLGNLIAVMEEARDGVHAAVPSVRDAVIARVRTRPSDDGRLAIASIESEPYWIAIPQRAWWSSPTSAMVRPLSIGGELDRLSSARCGERCERYAQSYRARRRMIAALFERPAPLEPTAPLQPAAPPRPARPRATETSPVEIPASLARGAPLRVEFAPGSSRIASHDEAQIRAIASLLLADRGLRVELVARPGPGEPGDGVALQRAHRARGLIAIRGPSRARFSLRAGAPADRAGITLRITR